MQLRQLEYLVALARERHFGRAAEACHVSQPTLSEAIRKLEAELALPLVHRGNRTVDLTPEGRALLPWAQRTIAASGALVDEAAGLRGQLAGRLRVGSIPTALPMVAAVLHPLLDAHAGVSAEIRSMASLDLSRSLDAGEIDVGLTYLDNEPVGAVSRHPIYEERYVLVEPTAEDQAPTVRWRDVVGRPLCTFAHHMQHRRIVDAIAEGAGGRLVPRVEADSVSSLLSFARAGWPCIVAESWLDQFASPPLTARRLVDPDVSHTVGLVVPNTHAERPLVRALLTTRDGLRRSRRCSGERHR